MSMCLTWFSSSLTLAELGGNLSDEIGRRYPGCCAQLLEGVLCLGLLGGYLLFFGYLLFGIMIPMTADGDDDTVKQPDTVLFECTWVCTWFDTMRKASMLGLLGALSVDFVVNFRAPIWFIMGDDPLWNRGPLCSAKGLAKRLLLEPIYLLLCYCGVFFWMVWSIDTVTTSWFAAFWMPATACMQGMYLLLSLQTVERYLMPERLRDVWRGWRLSELLAAHSAAAALWLMWIFRQSTLRHTWPDSPWASSVKWQAVWIDLAALLVGEYILAYDNGEPPDDVQHPRDETIGEIMDTAMVLASWPLLLPTDALDYAVPTACTILTLSYSAFLVAREAISRFRGPRALRNNLAAQRRTPGYITGGALSVVLLLAQLIVNTQLGFTLGTHTRTDFLCGGIDCGNGRECSQGLCCPAGFDGAACEVVLDQGFAPVYEVTGCDASAVDTIASLAIATNGGTGGNGGNRARNEETTRRSFASLVPQMCGSYYRTEMECNGAPVYAKRSFTSGAGHALWRDAYGSSDTSLETAPDDDVRKWFSGATCPIGKNPIVCQRTGSGPMQKLNKA